MALYGRWNNEWHQIGTLSQESQSVIKIGPRGSSETGFLDTINYENLQQIQLNVPVDTSTRYLFAQNKSLDKFPSTDFSRSTDAYGMFYKCENLTEVGYLKLGFATDLERMFYECTNLIEVAGIDATRATSLYQMFYNCRELQVARLDNLQNVERVDGFLNNSPYLSVLELHGLGEREQETSSRRTLDISSSTAMTTESMNTLVRSLGDTSRTNYPWILRYRAGITFDTTIATDKGWVLEPV